MFRLIAGARPSGRFLVPAFVLSIAVTGAHAQTGASVSVARAWARATPPSATNGAVYLTIKNASGTDDALIALSTPVAAKAELHATTNDGGIMSMAALTAAPIKAGGALEMKPGGTHVMLFDLKQPLKEGESFPLTLTFTKAGTIETSVTVEKLGGPTPHDMKM